MTGAKATWGGRRPGAGRPKGSTAGGPSQRFRAQVAPDYRAWMGDFAATLGGSEVDLFHEALRHLAEVRGFRSPPPAVRPGT
jgi:hypothetical protein